MPAKYAKIIQSGGDVKVYCYLDNVLHHIAVCPTLDYAEKYSEDFLSDDV